MSESTTMSFNDDCILHFATRYALGRRTGAVRIVCDVLKRDWRRLGTGTGKQIQREVSQAIEEGRAGDPCDVEQWRTITNLPTL